MRNAIIFLVLCGIAGGGAYYYYTLSKNAKPTEALFRTAKVSKGDLLVTVSANGTVEPEEVVDVGTQVMGRIRELGVDPRGTSNPKFAGKSIDYGSPVEKGMLLAQIDPSIYKAQFDQAHGTVEQAKANVIQSEAKLMQTDAEWKRAQRLRSLNLRGTSPTGSADSTSNLMPIKGISDADFILAQANYEVAKANVEVAKATVEQQTASLALADTNLGYTTIRSPVSGTIIDRRVNIGQTVVASLNAPSLFLIARDLRRMQVWASVNEADIGRIKVGTQVHFRVDAFPDDVFRGEVVQVRLNASMTQNVVTFTVVIFVENPELKLLPYLTADVKFEVNERKDVMLVPNSALRFRPKPEQVAREKSASDKPGDKESDAKELENKSERDSKPAANVGTLWEMDSETGLLHAIPVTIGLSDGTMTEVSGEHLSEGMVVILGENRTIVTEEVNNPLGPPKFRGNRSQNKETK